jgi:thiamine biosynthesis lipoprotein ApbE/uncharacterized protein with FMN-binding domain
MIIAAAWLLNLAAKPQRDAVAIPTYVLEEAQAVFPEAEAVNAVAGIYEVRDGAGLVLGRLLTTLPGADDLVGYQGPSNVLIALGAEGRVRRIKLLSSGDTAAHVEQVVGSTAFWRTWDGWIPAADPPPHVDAVSGSTLTSLAVAEAIERRLLGKSFSWRFPQPLLLDEVRLLFPQAAAFHADDPLPGWHRVQDDRLTTLGFAVRTSPHSDNVRGYQGPTEALLAVAADGRSVTAVRLRHSYDTPEYFQRVGDDEYYLAQLAGRTVNEWAELDFAATGIEGVSGATQTSFAVAEGIRRRFQADRRIADRSSSLQWKPRDAGLLAVVIGSLLMAFTPLRTVRRVRIAWQIVLVVGFGLWFGDLLSISLVVGWSRHGIPWQTAPVLVLLTALALAAPWATRRQLYCQHLCPHGAVQEWLGRFSRLHRPMPRIMQPWLRRLPWLLLALSFGLALMALSFDLAQLEPFDAWVLKGGAVASAIVAVIGLAASLFVPQAYCRFGCPTGALLKYVRSNGVYDRFQRRDAGAALLLALGAAWLILRPTVGAEVTVKPTMQPAVWRGQAFGTTWTVKLRGHVGQSAKIEDRISAELERIESTLSHWRPSSATAQFNASQTTLEMEQPPELIALVSFALELSQATQGAFDITVAPLVSAWGFGPANAPAQPPDEAQLATLLERVGWQKLVVDAQANTLRKTHPALQIDLGALLQGYAVDRVAGLLDSAGYSEYLIEVGGELRAAGAWTVAIENPADAGRPLRIVNLSNAALAISGNYRANHLISPVTGRPLPENVQLCAVMRPTCLEADGWATALLVTGLPRAAGIADAREFPALFLDQSGHVQTSAVGATAFDLPRVGSRP